MTKKHKKAPVMRRSVRLCLIEVNAGKLTALRLFLCLYRNVLAYFVERFWSAQDTDANLAGKSVTDAARSRFGITARLAQCAAKQAKELVRSQNGKAKKQMPRVRSKTAVLDSRFVTLADFCGVHFDLCARLGSGVPKLTIPLHRHAHYNKYLNEGWTLGSTVRLGLTRKGQVWLEVMFEKPYAPPRTQGATLGLDRGLNKPLAASDGQVIAAELVQNVKDKHQVKRKRFRRWLKSELNRELKKLDLTGVKVIVLEDLRNIKRGKRGTLPRKVNRLLSFWFKTRAAQYLQQRCDELGICIERKSPSYTSQRCAECGKIDRRNRRAERFKCVECGVEKDADVNAAQNLAYLGLAGVYRLRSGQTKV